MSKWEPVLIVGAEGGSLAIHGMHNGKCWQFSTAVNETPALSDEPNMFYQSDVLFYWKEAIEMLSKYAWHKFYPLEVHPAFRGTVLAEVIWRLKMEDDLENAILSEWLGICGQLPS